MGQSPPGISYNEAGDGIPFLQGKAEFGIICPSHKKYTNEPKKIAPRNTILISVRAPVGDVNVADIDYCIGRGLASISLSRGDNLFLFYLLYHLKDIIEQEGRGSTFKSINKRGLMDLTIPLPPLSEQKAIAHLLRTVQDAREKTEAVIEAAKTLKKSMMQYLFTYGPVPIDEAEQLPLKETEVGMVPEDWDLKKFIDFVSLQRGKDLPIDKFENGSIPVVGATKILGYHNVAILKGPGVTVVRSGSSAGKPQYIEQDFWPHNVVLYIKNFHGNYEKFVYYYLDFLKLERFKSGVAVPTLNKNILNNIIIPVPAKKQQEIIAQIIDSIENKITIEVSRKAALDQLFQTLLNDLMTAKIRVDYLPVPAAET